MAAWSSREREKPIAASMGLIASAIGLHSGGISAEMVDQMKRTVASTDCDGTSFMEALDRMLEDPDEEEHLGPLHDAAKEGKMDTCKHLVENLEFDVDVRANDGSGKTPLTCAVSCGKVIAVRYLIAKGADLNKQDAMGFTPLHYAAKRGHNGIARLLLSRGANVDMESSEGTPLHVAAARGRFGVMDILLEHHADPDRVSPDLYTPLAKILCATYEQASPSACLKCMKLLVKAGADLNSTNPDTPLVIATSRGLNECVDYLLEVGADANIPIKHGHKTPIEIAAKSGRRTLVESLFPFTSPVQTISDWSVEGILAYAGSRQSKHKDTKNQMNSNSERSVKEDASAPTGCTEDKLSDEDMKAQLKLQAVKGNDFAGASKFYTKGVLKCIVMLVCCMMVVGTVSAKEHCDSAQLKDQMGFCNAEDPNTLCCSTVYSIFGRSSLDTNSSCVCEVIQAGVSADKLKKYYYRCHGKNQGVDLLISQCKGTAPPPPPPSDTSPPPPAESTAPPAAVKQSWSKTTKIAFVILASIVITLSVWLTYLLIKKYKGQDITVNPSTEMSSIPRDTRLDIALPIDPPEPGVVQDTQVEDDASPEYYYDAPETEAIVERPPERKGWLIDMIFVPLSGGLRMLSHSVF